MDIETLKADIASRALVRSGRRFTAAEAASVINSGCAGRNRRFTIDTIDVRLALKCLIDDGVLVRDGERYRTPNGSLAWLCRAWRTRSNAELGITDDYTLAYLR